LIPKYYMKKALLWLLKRYKDNKTLDDE